MGTEDVHHLQDRIVEWALFIKTWFEMSNLVPFTPCGLLDCIVSRLWIVYCVMFDCGNASVKVISESNCG